MKTNLSEHGLKISSIKIKGVYVATLRANQYYGAECEIERSGRYGHTYYEELYGASRNETVAIADLMRQIRENLIVIRDQFGRIRREFYFPDVE